MYVYIGILHNQLFSFHTCAFSAQLVQETEHVVSIATSVVGPSLRKLTMKRLQLTSKHAATAAVLLETACEGAKAYNKSESSQEDMMSQCKQVSEQVALLVHALQASLKDTDNPHLQLELINTAKAFIPVSRFVSCWSCNCV